MLLFILKYKLRHDSLGNQIYDFLNLRLGMLTEKMKINIRKSYKVGYEINIK